MIHFSFCREPRLLWKTDSSRCPNADRIQWWRYNNQSGRSWWWVLYHRRGHRHCAPTENQRCSPGGSGPIGPLRLLWRDCIALQPTTCRHGQGTRTAQVSQVGPRLLWASTRTLCRHPQAKHGELQFPDFIVCVKRLYFYLLPPITLPDSASKAVLYPVVLRLESNL